MDITALSSPSLSFFYSLFLSLSPLLPSLLLLVSLAVQAWTDYTHAHTHIHSLAYTNLHLFEEPGPASTKIHFIFTIRSILDRPNGFQLPGLNLKANEVDAFLCPSLHPKKHDNSENRGLHIQFIIKALHKETAGIVETYYYKMPCTIKFAMEWLIITFLSITMKHQKQ